jgi:hypothetical protein
VPSRRINQNVYYRWSKEFLEAGKQRLSGNTKREATSDDFVFIQYYPVLNAGKGAGENAIGGVVSTLK